VRELWGRYWVFAHNGDLKDYAPRLHGNFRPVGDADSERAFCWLMQELAKFATETWQPFAPGELRVFVGGALHCAA